MSSIRRRPKRSAKPMTGRPPSAARRMMASPMPSSVPDRPAWSANVAPCVTWPNPVATLPSAATTPNWPNPEAKAAMAAPTTARSVQRCNWRPAVRGSGAVLGTWSLYCLTAHGLPNGPGVDARHAEEDSRAPDLHPPPARGGPHLDQPGGPAGHRVWREAGLGAVLHHPARALRLRADRQRPVVKPTS